MRWLLLVMVDRRKDVKVEGNEFIFDRSWGYELVDCAVFGVEGLEGQC